MFLQTFQFFIFSFKSDATNSEVGLKSYWKLWTNNNCNNNNNNNYINANNCENKNRDRDDTIISMAKSTFCKEIHSQFCRAVVLNLFSYICLIRSNSGETRGVVGQVCDVLVLGVTPEGLQQNPEEIGEDPRGCNTRALLVWKGNVNIKHF